MANMDGAATVLHVADIESALGFYTSVLGFSESFRYGDRYAGAGCGPVQLHLSTYNDRKPVGGGEVYITVPDVDAYYAEIIGRGAKPAAEPKDWPYGMRDFEISDPDGNLLTFGTDIAEG